MGLDRTRWPELLLVVERVRVLEVARDGQGVVHVAIETTDELVACRGCGVRAVVKDRAPVSFADLPAFGSPVRLVWSKRRWSCPEDCYRAAGWGDPPARYWVPADEAMRRLGILDRFYHSIGVRDCCSSVEIDFGTPTDAHAVESAR